MSDQLNWQWVHESAEEATRRRQRLAQLRAVVEFESHKVPPVPSGCISFEWNTPDCAVPIVCHLEYEAAEPADHYGPAPYPGHPEQMTLAAAFLRGVDITLLLSDKQIEEIEIAALAARSEG